MKVAVDPESADLLLLVEQIAQKTRRPTRALHLQALLQLPQLATTHGEVDRGDAAALLEEIANELAPESNWTVEKRVMSPRDLRFEQVPESITEQLLRNFHYLRSPRLDGRSYGLFAELTAPLVVCVSSPLDVAHLERLLDTRETKASPRVISRVFAFDGAPRNSLSHLLALAARAEASHRVTDLVTYVNPNMGFSGSSYLAANWTLLGDEPGTTYRYLDRRYITDRALRARFGSSDDTELERQLGSRFARSRMPLLPLLVFHYRINKRT